MSFLRRFRSNKNKKNTGLTTDSNSESNSRLKRALSSFTARRGTESQPASLNQPANTNPFTTPSYINPSPPTRRPAANGAGRDPPLAYKPPPYTPPIATTRDDQYAFLSSFDTVFLIDDSAPMAGCSWKETNGYRERRSCSENIERLEKMEKVFRRAGFGYASLQTSHLAEKVNDSPAGVSLGAITGNITDRLIMCDSERLRLRGLRPEAGNHNVERHQEFLHRSTRHLSQLMALALFAPVALASEVDNGERDFGGVTPTITVQQSSLDSDWIQLFGKHPPTFGGPLFVLLGVGFVLLVQCLIAKKKFKKIQSLRWIMGVTAYWSSAVLVRKDSPATIVFTLLLLYAWSTGSLAYAEFEEHQLAGQYAVPIVLIALLLDFLITASLSRRTEDLVAFFPPALSCSLVCFTFIVPNLRRVYLLPLPATAQT